MHTITVPIFNDSWCRVRYSELFSRHVTLFILANLDLSVSPYNPLPSTVLPHTALVVVRSLWCSIDAGVFVVKSIPLHFRLASIRFVGALEGRKAVGRQRNIE